MASETIEDIVREMRKGFNQSWWDIDREWAHDLADRIEAADMRLEHEMNDMCDENARLRAALKRLVVVSKNRMPSEPTIDEIESLRDADGILNKNKVKHD